MTLLRMFFGAPLAVLSAFFLSQIAACSNDASSRRCAEPSGMCAAGGPGGTAGAQGIDDGIAGRGGAIGSNDNALSVSVEDPTGMTVEIITLECSGDCAEVQAVAHGGNAPYTYAWDDGSTSATRRVCLAASDKVSVTATDTAIDSDEFSRQAQMATAEVTTTVLDCNDGGPTGPSGDLCIENPSFEGTPQLNLTGVAWDALPWQTCMITADIIDAGIADKALVPADGKTFVHIGTSGDLIETISQSLCAPLHAGNTYRLTLQIAAQGDGQDGVLEIWGGSNACDQAELLWASPVFNPQGWNTYCATLTPSQEITSLTLVPKWVSTATIAYTYLDDIVPVESCP